MSKDTDFFPNFLAQLSPPQLHLLVGSISKCLDDPQLVLEVKRRLHLGMKIRYLDLDTGQMPVVRLEKIKQTRAVVCIEEGKRRIDVPLTLLVLDDDPILNVEFDEFASRGFEQPIVGDQVSFTDKYGELRFGVVRRVNPKTLTLDVDGEKWRVAHHLIHKVVDVEAEPFVALGDDEFEKPNLSQPITDDNWMDLLDACLIYYGEEDSLLNLSELDGFFAGVLCAPRAILPSEWQPLIWGRGRSVPAAMESIEEVQTLMELVMGHYNLVASALIDDDYHPMFLSDPTDTIFLVEGWCEGFFKGLSLWCDVSAMLRLPSELERLYPAAVFYFDQLESVADAFSEKQRNIQIGRISPMVVALAKENRGSAPTPASSTKIGRNDPCPCGSGKKFKKCCMH